MFNNINISNSSSSNNNNKGNISLFRNIIISIKLIRTRANRFIPEARPRKPLRS